MYVLEIIKNKIVEAINNKYQPDLISKIDIVYPPQSDMGDLSLPCFSLAKELKKSPNEIASEIMSDIQSKIGEIESIRIDGAYLNLRIKSEFIISETIKQVLEKADSYGQNNYGESKRVMIEYSNVNTHKEYHIGHLRNLCYGDSVNRILAVCGFKPIPVSYVNDFGIHVAKTLWNYQDYIAENYNSDESLIAEDKKGYVLGKMYVEASTKSKEDATAKQMIGGIMKEIESRSGSEFELWQKTRQWSITQFDKIYQELDIRFEKIYYESEIIEEGKEMVQELLKKGILKESEGAVIADLNEYDLGVLVFLRSDGTATYPVADIPLAIKKIRENKLDNSIYVIDVRQDLYFRQLFKILELLGFKQNMIHLSYDFVKLPSGMMSSRSGNVITYEELKEMMMEKFIAEIKKRHEDWNEEKIQTVAKILSIGAIKFEMIKVGANNIITYDIDEAMRFDGYTAAYLQYAYARLNSIVRKSEINKSEIEKIDFKTLKEDREKQLALKIAKYSDVIIRAARDYNPSEIAKYLFELSQMFNDYYHNIPVLKTEQSVKEARLQLLASISQIINNGLCLLGIEVVDEM